MTHLLDTNVCIAAMRGHASVVECMRAHEPTDLGVSTVTLFELYSGIERCRDPVGEKQKVQRFIGPLHVVPFDTDAAQWASRVRWQLERGGTPIGPYDLQLAAQAMALEIVLVTHNTTEFQRVADLAIEDWQA